MHRILFVLILGLNCQTVSEARPQEPSQELIPHAQDRPPNAAKTPEEAIQAMMVPPGFQVEVVASEPDLVNPVSMTFDERGRIWVTESLEYPRREPGTGRDRVRVLEDTNGDGRADSFTTFAEGLNIPSGVAVGYGGVWVANSPDLLFIPDADRDARPDGPAEVVATGFGRDDTHELPNSLTWGPDGWLYGWNGVFNPSRVTSNNGKTYNFTCAIWRIHPKTREFQIWCEGVSNPWGIAINETGDFFASACVIDHLWHLVEGAYYIRQGGPYPAHTVPMRSIVDHNHQKAAYCGITWFDSPAYPAEYRKRLYMGNIHGNSINVDELAPAGSTYRAEPVPDFLTANDAWFMPVSQKTGPDGCMYILDWYDRYHCYQDANRDPNGIDRLKGRLYRIRYENSPRRARFDLGVATDRALIEGLASENVYDRETAQRILSERIQMDRSDVATRKSLEQLVLDSTSKSVLRRHALWALIGGGPLDFYFHEALAKADDEVLRAWGVRAAGDRPATAAKLERDLISAAILDPSPAVRLQATIAAAKALPDHGQVAGLILQNANTDDPLVAHLVWQKLYPLLEDPGNLRAISETVKGNDWLKDEAFLRFWSRIVRHAASNPRVEGDLVSGLALQGVNPDPAVTEASAAVISAVAESIREGRLVGDRLKAVRPILEPVIHGALKDEASSLHEAALELAASWGDAGALEQYRARFRSNETNPDERLEVLAVLVAARDPGLLDAVATVLKDRSPDAVTMRRPILSALGRLEDPRVGDVVLSIYEQLEPEVRPQAIVLLMERTAWSKALLTAIETKQIPATVLSVNQIRRLQQSKDPEIVAFVRKTWGTVREGRNERRELIVSQYRNLLRRESGDPFAGRKVFQRICAQCHKIYGEGVEVGPEITLNGRNDFDQLISNVLDPNLVIGPVYQAVNVAVRDGRVLTGLLAEDGKDQVVLTLQGGKQEAIPRGEVEELSVSGVSLMPEELETQLTPQEMIDLFTFLALDKPPEDPTAKRLPGAPEPKEKR